ncbi:DUF1697 domain-containing protein [Albibacterium bauzanense]|uniref:Uncharacterized protein (DUF1697 family) n=1 Tax=Albibacterium bauzanense TaxID=653929 RepID=A0A4R1LX33_9SPHI|nr:DUF1697 domain-containing protein [Albibacterium bauzanense]TCK83387.1 uncharacterized protein (DUF1697 family) [Albibacterium bauzanense]
MQVYISILRGINVSGHNLVKMDALHRSYESLGFQNVTTYKQSGNMVFTAEDSEINELEKIISEQIEKDFGFVVSVIVLTIDRLKEIVDNNPFLKDSSKDVAFLHATFLGSKPLSYNQKDIEEKKQDGEDIDYADNVVYLYCPNGYGRTKLSNNFLETKLKVIATTRNWKTTSELLTIAQRI